MITLTEQIGLQNVYTPLPFGIHLVFSVFATIVLMIQFFRKHRICYLLATLAIDATLITHFAFESRRVIFALEIVELVLVAGCIFDIVVAYLKRREQTRDEREQESLLESQQKEREKKEVVSDEDILDKAFDSDINDLDNSEN